MRLMARQPGLLRRLARRRPVRLRLTLIYSGLFLFAGVMLLGTTYGLVANSLSSERPATGSQFGGTAGIFCATRKIPPDQVPECKKQAQQTAQNVANAAAKDERASTLHHLMYYSFGGLGLMAIISALLGWVVAGRALQPVHAITAAARRASEENLGERIALTGPDDELKELADTFDAMLGRLDAAFASQRRFVANASHELRTPLTVMRTAIDVTLAKPGRTQDQLEAMAADVRQAVEHAEALIEALLTLARSDRGTATREPLDLGVLAEDALDAAASSIRSRPVAVRTSLLAAPATGDPVLVERLVTNLIGNAVRHNLDDGWIQVETGMRDRIVFLNVANSGPVIPAEVVPSLFEPFWRLSERAGSPDGTGLGLSIVRSVALAHGGQVSARPLSSGGLEVSVLLPAHDC